MLAIVGDDTSVGNWNIKKAKKLTWTADDMWQTELALPPNQTVEYKYITVQTDSAEVLGWSPGGNFKVSTPPSESKILVRDSRNPVGLVQFVL